MPAGRPPKPDTIAWLQGNRKRIYKVEPPQLAARPECPDWLDPIAKEEWEHITAILADMNLLSRSDSSALAIYCDAWSRYRKATEQLKKSGPVILSPNKAYPILNPYHSVMRAALADVTTFLREFGLTPCSRSRMAVDIRQDKPANDKWEGLLS